NPPPRTARNEPDQDPQRAMRYRALVFGVDGATFEVIDPLVAAGRMPALGGLMARGVRAGLRSTCPPVSSPAWPTFLTGKTPAGPGGGGARAGKPALVRRDGGGDEGARRGDARRLQPRRARGARACRRPLRRAWLRAGDRLHRHPRHAPSRLLGLSRSVLAAARPHGAAG